MSRLISNADLKKQALIFEALGDETRLMLVKNLSNGEPRSIKTLSNGASITRQAITKHLRVLEDAGLVRNSKSGRESLFALNPKRLTEAEEALRYLSAQWDQALTKLKNFVES